MVRPASSFQKSVNAVKAKSSKENQWGLHPGDRVTNPVWGEGTIAALSNMERAGYEEAVVDFPKAGRKKMLLAYAKLEKIG